MAIEFSFKVSRNEFALEVNQTLPSSGVTALYGRSGSGKTSLLRAIAGLDKTPNGQLRFNNKVWQSPDVFLPTHKRKLAYVFQEPSLFEHLSVKANLEYAIKRVPHGEQKISISDAIARMQIEPLLQRNSGTLSGGEKQRVAIARALCSSPQLLLMDEPLSALDRDSRREILPFIDGLANDLNLPIIYVSHALDEVARLADYLVLVQNGQVTGSGDIQTMLTQLDSSLAQDSDAESMVEAVVAEHDETFALTYLDSKVGRFTVLKKQLDIGQKVRVMIAARDVSLTKERQHDTSILNIFPATVDGLVKLGDGQVTVKLMANEVPILARLTTKSASQMKLELGDAVFLQAKSVALL